MVAGTLLSAQDIKDRIDLSLYVAGYLGFSTTSAYERKIGTGATVKFHSPWGSDATPSFTVFGNNTWKDFSSGKGGGADIFQLLQDLRGIDFPEALDQLRSFLNSPTYDQVKVVERVQKRKKEVWVAERLSRLSEIGMSNSLRVTHGLPYLKSRGISELSAFRFQLGTVSEPYWIADAQSNVIKLNCRAHTIPYLLYTPNGYVVRSLELRADPSSVREQWEAFCQREPERAQLMKESVCSDRQITPEDFDSNLIKYLNIPRYLRRGDNHYLYNPNRLIKVVHGKFERAALNQVLIVEGAYDAIILEQLGFPAVAAPMNSEIDLANAFQSVKMVYALYDNDKAGENRLMQWSAAIGADKLRPISIPQGYKDATDVYMSSPNLLITLLEEGGMHRIL